MTMLNAIRFFYSQTLNQIFLVMIVLFSFVASIEMNREPTAMLLPLFFAAVLLEQSIGLIQQNEFLRQVPKLARGVSMVGLVQFLIVALISVYHSNESITFIGVSLVFWAILNGVKYLFFSAFNPIIDMFKCIVFFVFMAGVDLPINVGAYAFGFTIAAALVYAASAFFPQSWSGNKSPHNGAISNPGDKRQKDATVFSLSPLFSQSAHSIGRYLPLALMLYFIIGACVLGSFFMWSNRGESSPNIFIIALQGIYLFSLFAGAIFSEWRQTMAWYLLRPGLGDYRSAIKKLFLSSLYCVMGVGAALLVLAVIWEYFVGGALNGAYIGNAAILALCYVALSVSLMIWFSSMSIGRVVMLTIFVVVGLGSWVLLLIGILVFHDKHTVSPVLIGYSLIVFLLAVSHSYYRYLKLNWL